MVRKIRGVHGTEVVIEEPGQFPKIEVVPRSHHGEFENSNGDGVGDVEVLAMLLTPEIHDQPFGAEGVQKTAQTVFFVTTDSGDFFQGGRRVGHLHRHVRFFDSKKFLQNAVPGFVPGCPHIQVVYFFPQFAINVIFAGKTHYAAPC